MSTHTHSRYVRPPLSMWLGSLLAVVLMQPFNPQTAHPLETQEEVPAADVLDRIRGVLRAEFPVDAQLDLRGDVTGLERLEFDHVFSATVSPREEQAVMHGDFFFGPHDDGWKERPA